MDPVYLVVSSQTGNFDLNVTLQIGDSPLLRPELGTPTPTVGGLNVPYSTLPDYNPQATHIHIEYRRVGTSSWSSVTCPAPTGIAVITGLAQGAQYELRAYSRTQLVPTDVISPYTETLTAFTDFLITIQQVRDTEGNPVSGAVVVALPQQDVITKIPASDYGSNLPLSQFAYARANKTNSQGACNIRIPGGYGKVFLLVVPPTTGKSGATVAGLETEEP